MHKTACDKGFYALGSAECLDSDGVVEKLEHYPVVFIGDHHTSKAVHDAVAELIRAFGEKGYRVHLANEWFTPEDDDLLARYAKGLIDDGNFTEAFGWQKKISYDFSLFSPIYHAVRDTGGFLYGINLSKEQRRNISKENLDAMTEEEQAFFAALDTNVSAHRQMLLPFFGHCHGAKSGETKTGCSERMYRVQVAWDTMMGSQSARLAERVLTEPREKLLVFAGAMHLYYGLGIDLRFSRLSNLPSVTIVPEAVSQQGYEHGTADYLYFYREENEEPNKGL